MQALKRFIPCEVESSDRLCSATCQADNRRRRLKRYLIYSALILSVLLVLLPLKEFCDESGGKNIAIRFMCALHKTLRSTVIETKNYVFSIGTIVWDFIKDTGAFFQKEVRNLLPLVGKSNKPIAKCPDCVPPPPPSKPAPAPKPVPAIKEPSIASGKAPCDCK